MKSLTAVMLGWAILGTSGNVMATPPCTQKIKALEVELGYAQTYSTRHRLAGVVRALVNAKATCREDAAVLERQGKGDEQGIEVEKSRSEYSESASSETDC